jgi:hypothetical protein
MSNVLPTDLPAPDHSAFHTYTGKKNCYATGIHFAGKKPVRAVTPEQAFSTG